MGARNKKYSRENVSKALDRLKMNQDHYYSCGIYYQGIITTYKPKDDPTYECTCGWWAAIRIAKWYTRTLPTVPKLVRASLR